VGFAAQKAQKGQRPDLGDLIFSRMSPSTQRKLAPAKVSRCPRCETKFVQQGYPRTFCSRNCSKAAWKRQQAEYLANHGRETGTDVALLKSSYLHCDVRTSARGVTTSRQAPNSSILSWPLRPAPGERPLKRAASFRFAFLSAFSVPRSQHPARPSALQNPQCASAMSSSSPKVEASFRRFCAVAEGVGREGAPCSLGCVSFCFVS
jgi:hypothetical protein